MKILANEYLKNRYKDQKRKVNMNNIPSWTSAEERKLLRVLAAEIPDGGNILEIGCLYGGTTYELASVNPKVRVTTVDNFSWTPEGYPTASAALAKKNLEDNDVNNVSIVVGTSDEFLSKFPGEVDLSFIDGGHSYEYVNPDLLACAKFSKVIVLHDYHNDYEWMGITKAVDEFLQSNKKWMLDEIVGMMVVLRRTS